MDTIYTTRAHEHYLLAYWAYHSSLLRKVPRGLQWGQREASEGIASTTYQMDYLFALGLLLTRTMSGWHWDRLHGRQRGQ